MTHLHIKNITVMRTDKIICHDLTFTAKPGEIWGILGPNGCGKTTLLHTLAGIHPINKGHVFLDETNLTALSRKQIAQKIGLLFQSMTATFDQSILDYCMSARYPHRTFFTSTKNATDAIVMHALKIMELDVICNRPITQLSGGEKRRAAIATLLAQTPRIYLLDEPTNHLDIRHQMHVFNYLRTLANKNSAAIIMALHDINLAEQYCDQVLLLFADGSIKQGKPHDVLSSDHLTQLYEHPMYAVYHHDKRIWQPDIIST